MNSNDIKQVVQSIERSFVKTVKAVKADERGIYRIIMPFTDLLDEPFYLWAFRYPSSKKIQLSDGRLLTSGLRNATGAINLQAIQMLVKTYDLALMEDESIMEITNRPLTERVTSFLQCIVAVDGVHRMWNTMKESKTA